jgi:hypothetical protein
VRRQVSFGNGQLQTFNTFVGAQSGREIEVLEEDRGTNVVHVTFKPIDNSGIAYVCPLDKRMVTQEIRSQRREQRKLGGAQ